MAAASACGSSKADRPSIRIVSPEDGSTINAMSLFMTVEVSHFELVPTTTAGPGEAYKGHWILFIDGVPLAAVFGTGATISDIPPGTHELAAELVNENDVPVGGTPPAFSTVTIPSDAPGVLIVSPDDQAFVASSSVEMPLQVSNFVLDSAAIGQPNEPGHGHYEVFLGGLDGTLHDVDATSGFTLTDLDTSASGETNPVIDVWVALANNDGTLLDPPAFDHRYLVVPSNSPRVSILSPAEGAVVGSSFTLSIATANFTLVDFSGSPADSPGQGHYHVLVDGSDLGPAFATTTSGWSTGGSGRHRVRVELRANTDGPLSAAVVDKVSVETP